MFVTDEKTGPDDAFVPTGGRAGGLSESIISDRSSSKAQALWPYRQRSGVDLGVTRLYDWVDANLSVQPASFDRSGS